MDNLEKLYKFEQMNSKVFFQTQLELEGLQIISGNRIKGFQNEYFDIEKKENTDPPKVIAVNFGKEVDVFYSNLMPENLVFDLEKFDKNDFIGKKEKITDFLIRNNQSSEISESITYIFPNNIKVNYENAKIFSGDEELIKKFDPAFYNKYPAIYAILQNNEIVACCVSARENDKAGEAWIFTLPKYRKQGFGLRAVQLWANELQKQGKIPFYSHEISNIASQKLAERLGLKKVFEIVSYD